MGAIRKAMYCLRKPFLLVAFSFILVTACYQSVKQKPYTLAEGTEKPAQCRIVQHSLGETCVPDHPKRVVILDEFYLLDNVSALGIKPVGFAPCSVCIPSIVLSQSVADIPTVGDIGTPSLEKVLSLKPDLILGLEWQKSFYPLLSKIAPTVMIGDPEISGFKKTLKYLAEVLNKRDRVDRILVDYDGRIQKFRQQLGKKLKTKTVSILGVHGASFYADRVESRIYSQVMNDAGIPFIPAYQDLRNDGYNTLSIETLPDWDADFLFILQNYKKHAEDLKLMLKQPLWSTLKAVQNKQVHPIILDVWGPITANRFIDDLYRYFIDAS